MKEIALLQKLQKAMNQHNLEAFLECFSPDYSSTQPLHPDRAFQGKDQVRKNWTTIFNDITDFRSELLSYGVCERNTWTEWEWFGTKPDGSLLHLRGIIIFSIGYKGIDFARLYMEPVEQSGAGIDKAIESMTK